MTIYSGIFPLNMVIFHSYVSFDLVNSIPMTDPFSVLLYMVCHGSIWIPWIYPSHVSIKIPAPLGSVMGLGHPKIWHTKFVDENVLICVGCLGDDHPITKLDQGLNIPNYWPQYNLVGGFNHLEKYESQWEGWHPILYMKWKIKVMFQTTNQ